MHAALVALLIAIGVAATSAQGGTQAAGPLLTYSVTYHAGQAVNIGGICATDSGGFCSASEIRSAKGWVGFR